MQKHITSDKKKRTKQGEYLKRVEEDIKGNPLLKPDKDWSFNQTRQDRINAKRCDHLGNPKQGYIWKKGKIVKL